MKLLVLFLDGFHPSYFDRPQAKTLRRLRDASSSSEMEPVLGFSNANKVTLFTGTTPDVHDQWCYFSYDPDRSPFRDRATRAFGWIDHVPSEFLRKGAKFALSKTYVRRIGRSKGYSALSWENVPLGLLRHFDHTEKDLVRGVGIPSLFTEAKEAGLQTAWVDVPWYPRESDMRRAETAIATNDAVVVYNANMDAAGHWFDPSRSKRFDEWLARTDELVDRLLSAADRVSGGGHEVVLVSDHGMARTERHIDVMKQLRQIPGYGSGFVPFIDSTMARFWFKDDSSRKRVERVMTDRVGHGRFLDREDARRFGAAFEHRRYGDAIYLLDPDTAFYPAFVSWIRPRGMHGYAPDHQTQTAVFLTTATHAVPARVRATHVLPHLLRTLGVDPTASPASGVGEQLRGFAHTHDHACPACR